MISEMLEKKVDETSDDVTRLDQYYFLHSNNLLLFGISEQHEAIKNHREGKSKIISVNFDMDRKRQRGDQKVIGKSKSKSSHGYLFFFKVGLSK